MTVGLKMTVAAKHQLTAIFETFRRQCRLFKPGTHYLCLRPVRHKYCVGFSLSSVLEIGGWAA